MDLGILVQFHAVESVLGCVGVGGERGREREGEREREREREREGEKERVKSCHPQKNIKYKTKDIPSLLLLLSSSSSSSLIPLSHHLPVFP